jgi:uncharacterized membrane protein YdjX (TVP38/TMEM64 family)
MNWLSSHQRSLLRLLALVFVIGISVLIFSIRDQARQLGILGYPGIFLLSFLAYATVILPAPGVTVVFTMGAVFHPFFVALAAGIGAALGELVGYLAGFSGQIAVERVNVYQNLCKWMERNGPLTVLVLSALPNPFFDLAGIAAGALKMPVWRFFVWCWLGETIKMLLFAYSGSSLLERFFR